ncbi:MAG TPA: CusA/CzcA family heavy metal efflux RND transporter [Candidatus Sulfotelmatobacter sp.]|jgi:cobalt-zinc-cadmium resistance protein CzcA|nr:CusA/CzcA family heavy metal efflux RND transporter [Candidatus Sulfotelmatobacter sp.]
MIRRVVDFALNNRLLVLAFALMLFAGGIVAFRDLPIEAYPDVADNYVEVITQWPGISAEQIEQQVTIPLEVVMNGIPHVVHLRSFSLFGLSDIKLIFDDESDNDWNRERVLERLSQVTLPTGVIPQMGTDWSPVGQIYFFTLRSTNPAYDAMELKSIEDWVIEKSFKSVPDIVDVSSFGGPTREYQVRIDPNKLVAYGLSLAQVEQQLTNNNTNAGGSFIQEGLQQINVRAVGLVDRSQDIAETVIMTKNGTPLRVKDIAVVSQGPKIRLGQFSRAIHRVDGKIIDNDDVVSGIVLLRKGAAADTALQGIHKEVAELNDHILPPGVKVVPFIDRSDLVHFTSHTVLHNLTEGMILVSIILFLFLGNVRGALIVAATIPFSLLFASICLDLRHIPANLLSLGALDFGMVVDGAVVMVENIVRHLGHKNGDMKTPSEKISEASHEVQRPVFYAIAIIITAYLPIFTLERVEGRLFHPMAWTVAFALLGALIFSILIAPVLASFAFRRGASEWHNPVMTFLIERYRHAVRWAIRHRAVTVGVVLVMVAFGSYLAFGGAIGSEFLPHLDEGALWVRGTLAPSTGPDEGIRVANQARIILCSFPEVPQCTSQVGRPDDGTDTTGFFNTEFFVDLKQKEDWRPVFHENKDELIAAMQRELDKIPGVVWGFSQPIEDNMEEAVSGVKGALATKIYGDDLKVLETKSDEVVNVMRGIKGVEDLGVFRVLGQPNLNVTVDRAACARHQINVADVQDAVQTAVGGNALTQVLKGEARYDLTLRYLPQYRDTEEAIENIRLLSPTGERVSLAQLCKISVSDGASEVYREGNRRYVAIKYSVRGRDLGSTVEEAIKKVNDQVKLPTGYSVYWEGEYQSQKRANARLLIVLPITILIIFILLYTMFKSLKWATLIMANIAIAPIGGLLALWFTGTNFSVSSGVGFLALFGVSVQTGVIMLEYINQLRARRFTVEDAAVEGAVLRLRPIMMTMLVATLGLLPAALSHAIGSDSQRPFAIVIVGGLIAALIMSVFLLPTLYVWVAGERDVLPRSDEEFEVGEHVD